MSETELTQVDIKPGINRDQTEYSTQGQYVDGQWVRFRQNKAEKMGGYLQEPIQQFTDSSVSILYGVPRSQHSWVDLEESKLRAVGTHNRLQLIKNDTIYDITPIETSVVETDNLSTVLSSPYITVSTTSPHTRQINDLVEVINTTSIGNVLLNGVYEVTSVVNVNAFIISVPVVSNITAVGAGGSVEVNYLLATGEISNGSPAGGWGGGTWGTPGVSVSAGWNNPRSASAPKKLRQWSLDNWGEDLIASPRGRRIYTWVAANGPETRATVISAAPSVNNFVIIAQPSRHLMSFGTQEEVSGDYDPLLVRWSDSENYNIWTTSVASEAGEFRLKGGSYLVGGIQSTKEIVAATDNAVHRIKYVGGDFIFGSDQVGSDAGLVSQSGIVDINGIIYWMGYGSFFQYDQRIRKLPCTLIKDTFDQDRSTSLNFNQKEKVVAGENSQYNEAIWFYPSRDSIENDRYIIFNYLENVWYSGSIERTSWDDVNVFDSPYATDASGNLFTHEQGKDASGQPLSSYIETGEIDIAQGNAIMFIDKFIPDFIIPDNKPMTVTLYLRKYPGQPYEEKTYTLTNRTEYINMRARARRVKVRYSVDGLGADYEIGMPEFGIKPDGKR